MLWLLKGGINADNCEFYVANGASHVIVTSYVFRDGQIDFERLTSLKDLVGKEHLVSFYSSKMRGVFFIELCVNYANNELHIIIIVRQVLDLSCRKRADDGKFYVMTDRWQKFTTTSIKYAQHYYYYYCYIYVEI